MKKVDIIHGGWLKAPNGASSVLRTLAESTSKFEEYGIQLSVYSMDLIVLKSFENIAAINQRNCILLSARTCDAHQWSICIFSGCSNS